MPEIAREQALKAVQAGHTHLLTAWRHLSGRRLPLAGLDFDLTSAASELQVACDKIFEALAEIDRSRTRTME
jgi:hypothetical protein